MPEGPLSLNHWWKEVSLFIKQSTLPKMKKKTEALDFQVAQCPFYVFLLLSFQEPTVFWEKVYFFLNSLFLPTVVGELCQFYSLVDKEFNNRFITLVAFLSYFLYHTKIVLLVERVYPQISFPCSCRPVSFQEAYCYRFNIMREMKDFQSRTKLEATGIN